MGRSGAERHARLPELRRIENIERLDTNLPDREKARASADTLQSIAADPQLPPRTISKSLSW